MCSCMFVRMLCMAAVTNLDTQSRRTGLPVSGTSTWRRAVLMVAHADEFGIPRSGAIKMQAPVHQDASRTTREPTLQPCTCMCARACFLMRVCACMHGGRPAVAVARAPMVLLLECRPTRRSPPPRLPRRYISQSQLQ
jgi:hypothetical protein